MSSIRTLKRPGTMIDGSSVKVMPGSSGVSSSSEDLLALDQAAVADVAQDHAAGLLGGVRQLLVRSPTEMMQTDPPPG